jgi:ornithine carbamoyltransferase
LNFISCSELTKESIDKIFSIADKLSVSKKSFKLKENSTMALFFEEPSTRTRVSLEVAMTQLGGSAIYIDAHTSQNVRGEALADTAKVLSLYCNFIAVRMNDHEGLKTIAKNSKVPVINALTSMEHPTQSLADIYTIISRKGPMKNLKIAFIGDISQNTANSLMVTAAMLGAKISLVGPKGYKPNSIYFNKAMKYSKITLSSSIEEGLNDADIVYTDTFVSMGDEKESSKRKKLFAPYQLNAKALSCAKKDAFVMHPLPAHRGEEITEDVLDSKRSIVWEQAKNKLLLEKAILVYLSERN